MKLAQLLVDNRAPEWVFFLLVAGASVFLTYNFAEGMGAVFVAVLLAAEGSKYVIRSKMAVAIEGKEVLPALGWLTSLVVMVVLSLAASAAGMMEFSATKDTFADKRAKVEKQETVVREKIASIDNQLKPLLETIAVYNQADKATVGSVPLLLKVEKLEGDKQRLLDELAALPVIPAPKLNALELTVTKAAKMTGKTISQAWWSVSMMIAVLVEFLCLILYPVSIGAKKTERKEGDINPPKPTQSNLPALGEVIGQVQQKPVVIPESQYQKLTQDLKAGVVKPVKEEIRKAAKVGTRNVSGLVAKLIEDGILMSRGSRLVLA